MKKQKSILNPLKTISRRGRGFLFWHFTRLKTLQNLPAKRTPKAWETIYFKMYPRLPQIALHLNHKTRLDNNRNIVDVLATRHSCRKFRRTQSPGLSLNTISSILYYSAGIRNRDSILHAINKTRRMYPSAGARYSPELYLATFHTSNISHGLYHYNVKYNTLEQLALGNYKRTFEKLTGQKWLRHANLVIIITAIFGRHVIKYSERGWRYIFLEAGHIGQNIQLLATSLNLCSCPIGGFLDYELIDLLDLREQQEVPLYLLAVGEKEGSITPK